MTNELKKAIEIVKEYLDMDSDIDSEYLNAQRTIIEALETHDWIPVSERLPEKEGNYITTVKSNGFYDVGESIFERYPFDITNWVEIGEVIAWMPLPKPYKAESEDRE